MTEELTPSAGALIAQYVQFLPGNVGIHLDDKTPFDAYLPIFDETAKICRVSGILLGDMLVEGRRIYGDEFAALMAAQGRPISTLWIYEDTARKIGQGIRRPWLDISAYREFARLPAPEQERLLVEVELVMDETRRVPTVLEIRAKSRSLKPAAHRNTMTASQKKRARRAVLRAAQPYEPTDDELDTLQLFNDHLKAFQAFCENEDLKALVLKLTVEDRQYYVDGFAPLVSFSQTLEKNLKI
jgi:hypothetical protein